MKLKNLLKEQQQGPVDYQYFLEQIDALANAVRDFEQELGSALETAEEQTGDVSYKQIQNQVARYLSGASKQVTGVYKLLDRLQDKPTTSTDIGEI
jgi:hypothetical protein